jgi:hypothetical protein
MKTLTATALLSIMFLSAGAFAGNTQAPAIADANNAVNVTVAVKNQAWPPAGNITVETCKLNRCIDI